MDKTDKRFQKHVKVEVKSKYAENKPKGDDTYDDPELFGLEIVLGKEPTDKDPYVTTSPASFVHDMVKRGANAAGVLTVARKLGLSRKKVKLLLEARGMPLPKPPKEDEDEEVKDGPVELDLPKATKGKKRRTKLVAEGGDGEDEEEAEDEAVEDEKEE